MSNFLQYKQLIEEGDTVIICRVSRHNMYYYSSFISRPRGERSTAQLWLSEATSSKSEQGLCITAA